jgi:5'-nucleotidase
MDAFHNREATLAEVPLTPGPFQPFAAALHALGKARPDTPGVRIRTALITSRNAPSHERAVKTLREWQIEVDEAHFLGGLNKTPFLEAFQPDFFFDDQRAHTDGAARVVSTGHVPYGIANCGTNGGPVSLSEGSDSLSA